MYIAYLKNALIFIRAIFGGPIVPICSMRRMLRLLLRIAWLGYRAWCEDGKDPGDEGSLSFMFDVYYSTVWVYFKQFQVETAWSWIYQGNNVIVDDTYVSCLLEIQYEDH